MGDGAVQESASASPSPLTPSSPLPVGLCLGNLGPSIPHWSKKGFAGAYFLKLNFRVRVVVRRTTMGETFTALTGNVVFWVAGEKKFPCSLGPRLLRWGCHPEKMNSSHRTLSPPPSSNPKLKNRRRWLRKISNVCTLTLCPAPDGIVFHSRATQMVPQSGPKPFRLLPSSPSRRCCLLETGRFN